MDLLADLPVASLPGPPPLPLVGRVANVLRFFRDPVGRLIDLHARYGDVAALSRGDATWVAVRGAENLRPGDGGDGRDVLSTLIRARDEDGSQLTEDDLVAHAALLLTASHETSSSTVAWTLLLLAAHPRVYADLTDELSAVLGGRAPSADDLARLPLLDRVVKESQRLLPATCIFFFRAAQEPFAVGGYALPAGTRLLASPFVAHRNPDLYPAPGRFDPSRWERLEPSAYEYLPFGVGPRMCVGAQFAAQAVRIALAVMLSRFRFEMVSGARVDRAIRGIAMGTKDGIPMRLAAPGGPIARPAPLRGDLHELVDGLPS